MPPPKYPGYGYAVMTTVGEMMARGAREGHYPLGIPDCPVIAEFLRQSRTDQAGLNLTALWNVQGCPPEMEPGRWVQKWIRAERQAAAISYSANGWTAVGFEAVSYTIGLDGRLKEPQRIHQSRRRPGIPVKVLLDVPTPLVAMFVICDVMMIAEDEISPREAVRRLMAAVVASVEGLDPWRSEAVVLVAQRALAGDKPPTGYWLN